MSDATGADSSQVDPAAIPAEFVRLGLTPTRESYILTDTFDGYQETCCCLLGERMIAKLGLAAAEALLARAAGKDALMSHTIAPELGLPASYLRGLDNGWSMEHRRNNDFVPSGEDPEQYRAGFDDGRAACEACVSAGLFAPRR